MKKLTLFLLTFFITLSFFHTLAFAASTDMTKTQLNSTEPDNTTFGGYDYFINETTHRLYRINGGLTEPIIPNYSVFGIYQIDNALYASALNSDGNTEVVLINRNNERKNELGSFATSTNESSIYDFLTNTMGMNTAAACGILANIFCESGFNPNASGDNGTSYGICQWHDTSTGVGRYTNLKNYCQKNGYDYTTITGQLWYLRYELTTSYTSTFNYLKTVSNDSTGAYNAGYRWCYYFEVPGNKDVVSVNRGNLAKDNYWPKYSGSTKLSVPNITNPTSTDYTTVNITGSVTVKWSSVGVPGVKYTYKVMKEGTTTVITPETNTIGTSFTIPYAKFEDGKTYEIWVRATAPGYLENNCYRWFTASVKPLVVNVTGVSLNKKSLTLIAGGAGENLTATVTPTKATNKNVTWKSSNPSIATVDSNGKVEAVKAGTAIITVTTVDMKRTATCKVTVPTLVTGISLNKNSLTMKVGNIQSLIANITPTNATNKNVTWLSSDPTVATIDLKRKIVALRPGTTTITATTQDGNKIASCTVTVIVPVAKVSLNKKSTVLYIGANETLIATVSPDNSTNKNVTWKSSNPLVATVDSNGEVVGVKAGKATITVTTLDGKRTAGCKVKVLT